MLLTNRRTALIHLCLAGMEAAWLTPFWLTVYPQAPVLWGAFALLLAGLLAWMLVLELLSRSGVQSPLYDLLALALMAVTGLLLVKVMLYPDLPMFDLSWLPRMVRDALNESGGLPRALALLLTNLVLWQRATTATSRDIAFFHVGMSFRTGILLLIAGALLATIVRGISVLPLLFMYFLAGLLAVAVARIGEKATEAQNVGVILPPGRFIQLGLAVGVTVGAASLLATVLTPDAIRRFLHVFDPLWRLVRPLILLVLAAIGQLLNPLLLRFEAWLVRLLAQRADQGPNIAPPLSPALPPESPVEALPPWLLGAMDVLISLVLLFTGLTLIGLLLLYLERVRKAGLADGVEEAAREPATFGGGILKRSLERVRRAARLVGRLGLGRGLLAAISVQNIYANLCRLARQRGQPRPPSQPPDDYLPSLARAFPGHDQALARITAAYMRVHYGDQPVTPAELAQVRADYRAVREGGTEGTQGTEGTEGIQANPGN